MSNKLQFETSPYLLQHADNPVDWYPWGAEALALAKKLDKPILLSIGYSACHWCHVMAHESFEDDGVADVLNAHFINIKVDREERPDIDQIYQTAHSMLSNKSGGWPLTVFLTPNQQPFFTGTYFPKQPRYNLPGFADLSMRVAQFYHEKKDDLAIQNSQLADALKRTMPVPSSTLNANNASLKLAFTSLESRFDYENGGFGSAPKFPNPADITLLLHAAKAGNKVAESMALQMLTAMANGGIYDQIGGGFCRYSVDEKWNIPHFEKMLYDNGQLLFLYCDGWQISKDKRYSQIIEETVAWLICEMTDKNGAFYSSLDADSMDDTGHSEEGAFYVWQPEEVKKLLTPEEFAVASSCFGFDKAANFENPHTGFAGWHPYLARLPEHDASDSNEIVTLMNAQTKLFDAREKRVRPNRDDKILTSWNALAIKGLARAGRVFNRPDWVQFAQHAVDFIREKMWLNKALLATCKKDGYNSYKVHLNAYCDDYAFLLDALIELLQADYRAIDLSFATELAEALLDNFEAEDGGFYFTSHSHETLIHRPKQGYDNATPNGNGIAAVNLQKLGHILGEPRYLQAAERTLKAFDSVIQANPAACASLSHALSEFLSPPTIVIIRGDASKMAAWRNALNQNYYPHHLFFYLDESQQDLPPTLLRDFDKDVNAWVCQGVSCSPNVNNLQQLLNNLQ